MIVEPTPTNPRSPLRRGLRLAGVALPLVLLVTVVAAGALGPRPLETAPVDATAVPVALATAIPAPATPAPVDARLVRMREPAAFPAAVSGLPVRSVAETIAARSDGRAAGIVAVAGYLSLGALPWQCLDAYLEPPGRTCVGRTLLGDWNWSWGQLGPVPAGLGSDLLPRFPPGTRGPIPEAGRGGPRSEPLPVVLLGSFDDPRLGACTRDRDACRNAFMVQRVVWVAGVDWSATLSVDPALKVDPNIPEIRASVREATTRLGRDALVLTTAVVLPATLSVIDPVAAGAVPPIPAARSQRPVTYVRGLALDDASGEAVVLPAPAIDWIVLDSITGETLARGSETGWPTGQDRAAS